LSAGSRLWAALKTFLARGGLIQLEVRIVVVGLDNAGKTTMLHALHPEPCTTHCIGTSSAGMWRRTEFQVGSVLFCSTPEISGSYVARRLWADYLRGVSAHPRGAIVFVVDAADPDRFPEACAELSALLQMTSLAHVPVLCLGNKIDRPTAVPQRLLAAALGLPWRASHAAQDSHAGGMRRLAMPCSRRLPCTVVPGELAQQCCPLLKNPSLLTSLRKVPPILHVLQNAVFELASLASACHTSHNLVQPMLARHKDDAMRCPGVNPDRRIALFMCSVVRRVGHGDAFTWLSKEFLN